MTQPIEHEHEHEYEYHFIDYEYEGMRIASRIVTMNPPDQSQAKPMASSQSEARFLEYIEKYQRMLLKVCWAYTRTSHDRDDLMQEIVGRLWAAFESYDPQRSFSTWMYRVALNVAIDFRRRQQRRSVEMSLSEYLEESSAQAEDPKEEGLRELRELLNSLEEADRAILVLSLEGHSYRDIGEIIGISETNVGTRLSRLKQTLRDAARAQEDSS